MLRRDAGDAKQRADYIWKGLHRSYASGKETELLRITAWGQGMERRGLLSPAPTFGSVTNTVN